MEKKKLPKGCRVIPETGEVECEEGAKEKLESVDDEEKRGLFNRAPVEYEDLNCHTDRKDGKFKCKARFSADKKPSS